ncbi:MAG: hypothetical protein LBN27_13550 [Prevotellaceae bacterium]|jgi:hypothetical protein|nr:hypothetical protein [Prevotellaceae bacterium]
MKTNLKTLFALCLFIFCYTIAQAQTWTSNSSEMYLNPLTTKLGIGTSTPNAKFHINSSDTESPFQIDINGETKFTINPNGDIGVGSNPFWQAKLFVNGSIGVSASARFFVGDMFSGKNVYLGHGGGENGVGLLNYYPQLWIRSGNDIVGYKYSLILDTDGKVGVGDFPDYSMFNINSTISGIYPLRVQVNRNDKFVVTYLGDVGIGISSPQYKLDVDGSARIVNNLYLKGNTSNEGGNITITNESKTQSAQAHRWSIYNMTGAYGNSLQFWAYNKDGSGNFAASRLTLMDNGNVGIGKTPTVKLDVDGTIQAKEVKVCLTQGCDYVFDKNYNLMSLNDVESYINTNKHLPDVAPAAEMEAVGIDVSEMSALFLRKIEELTLYMIDMKKENEALKQEIELLKARR